MSTIGRMAEIVAKLVELQADRTDAEMGDLLGCSRSHWAHIRAGRRRLTYPMLKRAIRAFPSVSMEVADDLGMREEVPA